MQSGLGGLVHGMTAPLSHSDKLKSKSDFRPCTKRELVGMPLISLMARKSSKLRVGGSNPPGVASYCNDLTECSHFIPTNQFLSADAASTRSITRPSSRDDVRSQGQSGRDLLRSRLSACALTGPRG